VDADNNRLWANIDHAFTYAMAPVPEPATLALVALGGVTMLVRRRRQ